MFTKRERAHAVREHMLNAIWMISASAVTSAMREASEKEKQDYKDVTEKICRLIEAEVLSPINKTFPDLAIELGIRYHG